MRLARKLFLLSAMALAALALTAGSASAQFEVLDESTGQHCDAVAVDGHSVTGGCHVEFEGVIPLWAHLPAETPVSNCHVLLEAHLDETGEGYVESAALTATAEPPAVPCTRAPCDEAGEGDPMEPWPIHLVEVGPGDERVEATFCLRTTAQAEGDPGVYCEVHLELTDLGDHAYEVGHENQHQFCEVSPFPFPVSITNHLETVPNPEEAVEIIHN